MSQATDTAAKKPAKTNTEGIVKATQTTAGSATQPLEATVPALDMEIEAAKAAAAEAADAARKAAAEVEQLRAELAAQKKRADDAEAEKAAAETKIADMSKEAEAQAAKEEAALTKQIGMQRKHRIIIHSGKSESERFPVAIGVNGHEVIIERDKEVDVPEAVCGVLDLAVQHIPVTTGSGINRKTTIMKSPTYPYTKIGPVDPVTEQLVGSV